MNRVSVPALGNIRLKSGGATVRVFVNPRHAEISRALVSRAMDAADGRRHDIHGFAIVAWGDSGNTSIGVHVEDGRFVGRSEVPEFVKQL